MPTSSWDGRKWVTDRFAEVQPTVTHVIDVGPGEGTYSVLGRHLVWWAWWIGVEIFEPYVDRFLLGQKYNQISVRDIRDWRTPVPNSLVIFGDVLEHMPREDAVKVLEWWKQYADHIFVSVPIVESIQGSCFGNDHEAHVHQWSFDEMWEVLQDHEGTLEGFKGVEVGRWWWSREA